MMHDHNDPFGNHDKRREAWRTAREAKRAAWRARRAARHARRGDWSHFGDPKFWGLDAETMKQWGMGGNQSAGNQWGANTGPSSEVAALQAKVADMEKIIASLSQRVIVLEKLVVDDDKRLAAEIEKLRDTGK
jgi:hypothetical protein